MREERETGRKGERGGGEGGGGERGGEGGGKEGINMQSKRNGEGSESRTV